MDKFTVNYIRDVNLKKITKRYCDDNTLYYKHVITYNEFDQPITSEEWIYNEDGTTHYEKEITPHFACFGELRLSFSK